MLPDRPPAFCVLGRSGDIILLLPAFREVYRRTGFKPVVIVSQEYANIFEGVSYVQPHPLHVSWYEGVPAARHVMQTVYGGGTVLRWWDDDPSIIANLDIITREGGMVLQSHGHNWGVDMAKAPNFMASMWYRAGFSFEEMLTLPLVFDRRNRQREAELLKRFTGEHKKPLLLYNFTGISSPFGYQPDVLNPLLGMQQHFRLVDLGKIQAHRIYDLLGLYDNAVGLITSDTATFHLAAASKVPWIGFSVDGWTGSIPKGNCVLHVKYNETPRRIREILDVIEGWKQHASAPVESLQHA